MSDLLILTGLVDHLLQLCKGLRGIQKLIPGLQVQIRIILVHFCLIRRDQSSNLLNLFLRLLCLFNQMFSIDSFERLVELVELMILEEIVGFLDTLIDPVVSFHRLLLLIRHIEDVLEIRTRC